MENICQRYGPEVLAWLAHLERDVESLLEACGVPVFMSYRNPSLIYSSSFFPGTGRTPKTLTPEEASEWTSQQDWVR